MPEEQPSQHLATLRFVRGGEVDSERGMAWGHATIGIVLAEAWVLSDVGRSHDTFAPESRSEHLGISRLGKLGEGFARYAGQCVERVRFPSFIEHIVEERAEGRAREL